MLVILKLNHQILFIVINNLTFEIEGYNDIKGNILLMIIKIIYNEIYYLKRKNEETVKKSKCPKKWPQRINE